MGNPVISTPDTVLDITLSLDTFAYTDGDVLAATQAVEWAFRKNGGTAIVQSLFVLDEDDQGVAFDLVFLDDDVALGSENSAPILTDADASHVLGFVRVGAGDYIDFGGSKVATLSGLGLMVKAASSSSHLYVAAVTRGTPTHTASGLKLKLGLMLG